MKTRKLYYEDVFLAECDAIVTQINDKGIVTDQTVAFPEGGGQIGDTGILILRGEEIPFQDTQKGLGEILHLNNFPSVQVNTPVIHVVEPEVKEKFRIGDKIKIRINVNRRIRTTVMHSGLHLVLMAARNFCPELSATIKGCSITEDSARLDFFTTLKFTPDNIADIEAMTQELIDKDLEVKTYVHEGQDEAWYWQCEDFICPCGGTHVTHTGCIGKVSVKRKNVGKTTERIILKLTEESLTEKEYH